MIINKNKIKSLSFMIPLGIFILSIIYFKESFNLNFGTLSLPEEGMLPVFIGSILLIGSFVLMVQVLAKPQEKSSGPAKNEIERVILFSGVLLLYVIILPFLGFIISSFLLIQGTMKLMDVKLRTSIITGIIVIVVSYYLFNVWLNVPLPSFAFLK